MTALWSFIIGPIGRYVAIAAIVAAAFGATYVKGRMDGRAAYKAKIEREIDRAVKDGNAARARELRRFDALPDDSVPDDGFRRP